MMMMIDLTVMMMTSTNRWWKRLRAYCDIKKMVDGDDGYDNGVRMIKKKYDHGIVTPNTNRCWNCSRAFCVMIDLKVMIIMIIDHD